MKKINKKKRILKFLEKAGRSSTSKIASNIKSDIWMCQKYLNALKDDKLITEERETRGTFWSLR